MFTLNSGLHQGKLTRRRFTQIMAVPSRSKAIPEELPPVFEKTMDGALQWSVGNSFFLQQVRLHQGMLYCSSLLNRRSGREWIHPSKRSVEFLVQIGKSRESARILTGEEKWGYLDHSSHARDRGWNELESRWCFIG